MPIVDNHYHKGQDQPTKPYLKMVMLSENVCFKYNHRAFIALIL